jgi:hypothetical protein
VIAVHRFDDPDPALEPQLADLLAQLSALPGFVRGQLGRAADDEAAWALVTEWQGAGAYRRALSAYPIKLLAPLLGRARPEASAFEVVASVQEQQPMARTPSDRSGWRGDAGS